MNEVLLIVIIVAAFVLVGIPVILLIIEIFSVRDLSGEGILEDTYDELDYGFYESDENEHQDVIF